LFTSWLALFTVVYRQIHGGGSRPALHRGRLGHHRRRHYLLITIAALTLASSQFGPRLLRTFMATFMYCLIVLRTVRGLEDTRVVPHLSVTVDILLAVASSGVLIYFIHHVAASIQADHVIRAVSDDLDEASERLFPEPVGHGTVTSERLADNRETATIGVGDVPISTDSGGYLQMVDAERMMRLAVEHDMVLHLILRPGDFVVPGSSLARVSACT
jgi:uncharacterized membrane protein